MFSLTPVILKHRIRPDGSADVKIRVTKDRQSAYLPTNIKAHRADLAKGALKSTSDAFVNAMAIVREVEGVISKLPFSKAEAMTAADMVKHIKSSAVEKDGFRLDFTRFMIDKAQEKSAGNRGSYVAAAHALLRYTGGTAVDISAVTARFLRGFETYLKNEASMRGKGRGEAGARKASKYLACVRHMHNLARLEYNDPDVGVIRIPLTPFDYYKVPPQNPPKHRNKSVEVIQALIDSRKECTGRVRLGVDVFLISFALMGMNSPDMYAAKKPKGGIVVYNRQKTRERRFDGAEMRVRIEEPVKGLIAEYAAEIGPNLFNFSQRYANFDNLTHAVDFGLRKWCEDRGEEPFSLYSARHSWGTIANSSKCHIDKYIVNDALCHVDADMKVTDIYVEKDWTVFWEANAKVLSLFDWSRL